jgi:uncharacterized peroxidase-related enzyme
VRLALFDTGQDLPTRMTFAAMRRVAKAEVPAVIQVSSYRHRYFGTPFHAQVQDLLRGPSSWTVGERELFAAFTSARNQCRFCTSAHGAFATELLGGDAVAGAIDDPAGAEDPKVAAVLAFLAVMADEPETLSPEHVRAVRAAGVDDAALEEAVRISALFHLINRVMDAMGAGPLEGRSLAFAKKRILGGGYKLPPPIARLSRRG